MMNVRYGCIGTVRKSRRKGTRNWVWCCRNCRKNALTGKEGMREHTHNKTKKDETKEGARKEKVKEHLEKGETAPEKSSTEEYKEEEITNEDTELKT